MERQSSFGSQSSAGSAFTGRSNTAKLVTDAEKENAHDDGQPPGLLTALFGALYTLAKEKINDSANIAMLAIWVDFLMIFTLILMPEYPWDVDANLWIYKVFYYIQIHLPIANTGYSFYLVIFYILVVILFISVVICIWVGWCFMNDNFPFLWPIKVARIVVSLFVSMFYIASLNIFLMACACEKRDGHWTHLVFHIDCLSFPHLIHAIMSLTSGVIFFAVAILLVLGDHELEPMSRSLLAAPHSMCELRSLLCKTVITISDILLKPLPRVQTVLYTISCGLIFYYHARMVPHYVTWINVLRGGLNAVLAWVSLMACILTYTVHWEYDEKGHPHWDMLEYRHALTTLMAVGVPVAFIAGAGICWAHLVYAWRSALKFTVLPDGIKPRNIHRFTTEFDVEVASRIGRVWDAEGVLDQTSLEVAENVLKAGIAMKPNSVFMHIAYSNFLIDVRDNIQSGWSHLEQATKLGPNLSYQFSIFTRKQEQKQQSGGAGGGESGAVDLVSYVEFQKNYRSLMVYHKASLVATRDFWRLLTRDRVPMERLVHGFKRMDEMETKAEQTYKLVLDRYPGNAKLLKSYGKFLENVKNDPWGAAHYYAEAEKQEELEESRAADIQVGDDVNVNDKSSGIISINATGIIQMANKVASQLLGYKKGELEGKNVNMLMPAPFSQRHNSYLRNYTTTGRTKILDTVREVVALHKYHYVFPVSLKVTKVSGSGVDSMFMGIIKPTEPNSEMIKAWLLPTGTILCVDTSFMDYAGWGPEELVGRPFSSLGTDSSQLDDLIGQSGSYTADQLQAGALHITTSIKHKYAQDVPVHIKLESGGSESQRILMMHMKCLAATPPMGAFDHKGRCLYANSQFASLLGYKLNVLKSKDISQLMPQPYGVLHLKYLKEAENMQPRDSPSSCRTGITSVMLTSNNTPVYVKPTIMARSPAAATSLALLSDHAGSGGTWAITLQRSSRAQQLDEIRLCLGISSTGTIVWSTSGTPDSLFGAAPGGLIGQPLTNLVDIFAEYQSGNGDMAAALAALINFVTAKPGASWRVGVGNVTAEDQAKLEEAAAAAAVVAAAQKRVMLRQASGKHKSKAAIMSIALPGDESLPEEAASAPADVALFLELWRADMLLAVAEVVEGCKIVRAEHNMGLLFGTSNARMVHTNLGQWLGLPATPQLADLMGLKGPKKGGLKSHMHKVGPSKQYHGLHADQQPLTVSLQACLKDGTQENRLVLMIKVVKPVGGAPGLLARLVAAEIEGVSGDGGRQSVPGLDLDKVGHGTSGTADLLGQNTQRPTQRTSNAPDSTLVTARLVDVDMPEATDGAKQGWAPAELAASPRGSQQGGRHHHHGHGHEHGVTDVSDGAGSNSQHGRDMDVSSGSEPVEHHVKPGKKKHLTEDEMEAALAAKGASKAKEWLESGYGGYKAGAVALPGAVEDLDGPLQLIKARGGGSDSSGLTNPADGQKAGTDGGQGANQTAGEAGSESQTTGSTAGDAGIVSDYGRGKRLRKLMRLLSSKAAMQVVVGFRLKLILLSAAVMIVHMGAFGALLSFIGRQDAYLDEVAAAGEVVNMMQRTASLSLVLDGAQRGYGFTSADITKYAEEMETHYTRLETLNNGLYLGFDNLRSLDNPELQNLWHDESLNATFFLDAANPSLGTIQKASLFTLASAFVAAAKDVKFAALNPTSTIDKEPLAASRPWRFLQANGPDTLFMAYLESLDLMVQRAEDNVTLVERALLALLCIEGAAFLLPAVALLIRLLNSISIHRQALFSVFLAIPNSYLRTLASKSVSIGDEDADDEEADRALQAAVEARKHKKKQEDADVHVQHDQPASGIGAEGGKKALKASFAVQNQSGDGRVDISVKTGMQGSAAGGKGAFSMGTSGNAAADRKKLFNGKVLVASTQSSYQLAWPFFLWGVLVLVIYGIGYSSLSSARDALVSTKMTQEAVATASRITYYSLRINLEPDLELRKSLQPIISHQSDHLRWMYSAALYGVGNTTGGLTEAAADGDTDASSGSLFAAVSHKEMLFDVEGCLRYDQSGCHPKTSPYWAATNFAIDPLVMRLADETELMALTNVSALGPDNPSFNYIWQASWYDMYDGMAKFVLECIQETKNRFDSQRTIHIILVLVMVFGGSAFLVMMLRPFLKHISKESRRCAELLVQLPPDLDVEGMVAATWGVVKQERLMVERSGRTFIDKIGMSSIKAGFSMLSRSFTGGQQQPFNNRLSDMADFQQERLFNPRDTIGQPQGPSPRRPPGGRSRPPALADEADNFFADDGDDSRTPAKGGGQALRQRRAPGASGAGGYHTNNAGVTPRAAGSRRAIVPVDDDLL